MLSKVLISLLLFIGVSLQTYSQPSLIGNWKRVKPIIKNQTIKIQQKQWGDLEIRSDSTFHIQGDTATQNSTTPGWHTGDEFNGTWRQQDNKHLMFLLEPKQSGMFLSYKIVKLSKEKLVLRSNRDKRNRYDIVYLRLK
jgi:hypothetical protein